MLQATDHRLRPAPRRPGPSPRRHRGGQDPHVLRPVVADALAAGFRPAIYGGGFGELVDPSLVVADHVGNESGCRPCTRRPVSSSTTTWGPMAAGLRLQPAVRRAGLGTPVISTPWTAWPSCSGAVPEYRDPAGLRALVDEVLADPAAAWERAARGRDLVLADHTMDHRAWLLDAAAPDRAPVRALTCEAADTWRSPAQGPAGWRGGGPPPGPGPGCVGLGELIVYLPCVGFERGDAGG